MTRSFHRDGGFTLLELMIIVVLVGILTAIAIPSFLAQRRRAWEGTAQSDIKSAATAGLSYHAAADSYTDDPNQLAPRGLVRSDDVDLWFGGTLGGTRFRVEAQHCRGGDRFRYFTDGAARIERVNRDNTRPVC